MKKYIFLILLLSNQSSYAQVASKEQVLGYISAISDLYLRVYSGGCTEKKDFIFEVHEIDNKKLITFYRKDPDYCRSFLPTGKTLVFSYRELGLKSGDHFRVANEIQDGLIW